MTVVEDGREAGAESEQESAQDGAKTRRSRRPKVGLDEEREIARLYGDAGVQTSEIRARFGIGESSLYRIIQREGVPLRGRSSSATAPATQPAPAAKRARRNASSGARRVATPSAASAASIHGDEQVSTVAPAKRGRAARQSATGQPRTPASASNRQSVSDDGDGTGAVSGGAAAVVTLASKDGRRFRIRYRGERVVEADNIQDALRQAESLGTTDIVAVTRED